MVIYLDQYRAAKAAPVNVLRNGTYGDEILNAGWNPVLTSLTLPAPGAPEARFLEDLATADIDTLLADIYALATQV